MFAAPYVADISPENTLAVAATATQESPFATRSILGVNFAVSSYDEVVQRSLLWAREEQSRAQIYANVHVVIEAVDNAVFLCQLNSAYVVNPDGKPHPRFVLKFLGQLLSGKD